MHSRYVVAVVAIVAVGFALRWLFFSNPTADAEASSTMNIFDMQQQIKDLPVLDIKGPI